MYLNLAQVPLARLLAGARSVDLKVYAEDPAGGIAEESFRGLIREVGDRGLVLELQPEQGEKLSVLEPGRMVAGSFTDGRAVYFFKSRVVRLQTVKWDALVIEVPGVVVKGERRRYRRTPITLPVIFRISEYKGINVTALRQKFGAARCADISPGGLQLSSNLHLPLGMVLILQVMPAGQEPVTVKGEVRRVRSFGGPQGRYRIGVCFVDVDESVRRRLETIIAEQEERLKLGIVI